MEHLGSTATRHLKTYRDCAVACTPSHKLSTCSYPYPQPLCQTQKDACIKEVLLRKGGLPKPAATHIKLITA